MVTLFIDIDFGNNFEIRDPLQILKVRLAKGEISKNEYNELYSAISS
jgi:uncharacterized membrane protein